MKTKYLIIVLLLMTFTSCYKKNQTIENDFTEDKRGFFITPWKYEFNVPEPNKNAYRLWIPENVIPRGILVLSPGNASDGTNFVDDPDWQAYAIKEQLALVGTYVRIESSIASDNLILAIDLICKNNQIESISNLPFLLRGHSSGGVFSYNFASFYPSRTLVYTNLKGTLQKTATKLPPGLLIVGENDLEIRNNSILEVFQEQRSLGAITCFAVEPNGGHGVGDVDLLVRAYFSAILQKSLINKSIEEIDETKIYLGNNSDFSYNNFNDYLGDKLKASCLIDATFALEWYNFVK